MRWAGLLKGVNVGGNRKLPMTELKRSIEAMGHGDVKTLLASGNIVFSCDETDSAALEQALEAGLRREAGLATDILVRSHAELCGIIDRNPFPDAAQDHPNHLIVSFHRDPVPVELVEQLAASHDGPERLHASGRDLYVDYPEDVGHSTLPKAMAKLNFPRLATARNWNTVVKLAALIDG